MESQQIVDKETGMLRPVRYQDIVILTRSPAGWTDTVTRILQEEGIPVLAESADGYFETLEIGWMMDYLRVLDNFRQDIPLVAVLKSPFGRMTNEELAQIRELNAEVPFYQNVLETADPEKKTDLPAVILKKVRDVFGWLFYFRERILCTNAAKESGRTAATSGQSSQIHIPPALFPSPQRAGQSVGRLRNRPVDTARFVRRVQKAHCILPDIRSRCRGSGSYQRQHTRKRSRWGFRRERPRLK